MLLTVPEGMRRMIAVGFQRIVLLILDLPAGAPCGDKAGYVFPGDRLLGHKGIVVKAGALLGCAREVTPIDVHGSGGSPERELRSGAISADCEPQAVW